MVNYDKINKLRKYDGFEDLVEHFRREAETLVQSAISSPTAETKLRFLALYEAYSKIITFLEQKPLDKS